jgi:phosphatidate cytidylyltransferase
MAESETSHAPVPASAAPARPPASELALRVASSLVLAAVALAVAWADGWVFAGFWFLAAAAILCEWIAVTGVEPRLALQLALSILLGGLSALVAVQGTTPTDALPFIAAAALVCVCGRTARDRRWAAAGFAYAAVIALVPPLVREHPRLGLVAVLWMFAVVWLTDIAAYFAGRRFGGPKLWPAVSPKKTWSGFLGGLAAAVAAGAIVVLVARRFGWDAPVPLGAVILASALASVASQLGDLGESALKRRFGAKDSGALIPGHGGVMDRLDGFWAVAALMGLVLAGLHLRQGWAAG